MRDSGISAAVLCGVVFGAVFTGTLPYGLSKAALQDQAIRVGTQLVLVDVVAFDENGAVDGLTARDFVIRDNGAPQTLAVFEETRDIRSPEAVALPPGVASNKRDWRGATPVAATVVLVDRLNTPTADQVLVNQRLLDFSESTEGLERMALFELSDEFRVVHAYTDRPEDLVRRVAELKPVHSLALSSSGAGPGFEADLKSVGRDRLLDEFLTPRGPVAQRFERQSGDYFLDYRARRTLEALQTIAFHLEGLPGRKNLVWLSGRFPFTFDPWNRTDLADEVDRTTLAWMQEVGFLLTRSNVAVYPIDVRGPGDDGDAEVAGVIHTIARMTGGRPYYGTNDVGHAIGQAVQDTRVVYTLGFYPSEVSPDRAFRAIDVEVRRESVGVLHRAGYFAFRGSTNAAPARSLADILVGILDATAITLVGRAQSSPQEAGSYQLLVLADMKDLNMSLQNGSRTGEIDFAGLFQAAENGRTVVLPAETIPIKMTEQQYQRALNTGFLLQKTVNTNRQKGRMRFVVRDRTTGAAGSVWIPVGSD